MSHLGVTDARQVWSWRDLARKLLPVFGKLRGLWRCYYLLTEILTAHDAGEHDIVGALVVQGLKSLHQVALDHGGWENAQLLLPYPDPLGRLEFGGEEGELEAIHKYRKSTKELKARHNTTEAPDDDHEEPPHRQDLFSASAKRRAAQKAAAKAKEAAAPER